MRPDLCCRSACRQSDPRGDLHRSASDIHGLCNTSQVCQLLAFGQPELTALLEKAPRAYIGLLLAAGLALAPVIRRFISLGLNRVWLNSGDTIYRRAKPLYKRIDWNHVPTARGQLWGGHRLKARQRLEPAENQQMSAANNRRLCPCESSQHRSWGDRLDPASGHDDIPATKQLMATLQAR